MALDIREDDLGGGDARALVAHHLTEMHAASPPGTAFALDADALTGPGITFWVARDGAAAVGMAALRDLGDGTAELKSMRTHPDHLRRGVAAALLEHVIAAARRRGLTRLSLETGSGPLFEPALRLYRRRGFMDGAAFGGYSPSEFNQFLHLKLAPPAPLRPFPETPTRL